MVNVLRLNISVVIAIVLPAAVGSNWSRSTYQNREIHHYMEVTASNRAAGCALS
jgi:hypothetical protein